MTRQSVAAAGLMLFVAMAGYIAVEAVTSNGVAIETRSQAYALEYSPLGGLRDLHQRVAEEDGYIAVVGWESDENVALGSPVPARVETIWWSADANDVRAGEMVMLEYPWSVDARASSIVHESMVGGSVVAVGRDGRLLDIAFPDESGRYIEFPETSGAPIVLAAGAAAIVASEYDPMPFNPCDIRVGGGYSSPEEALESYLRALDGTTERAREEEAEAFAGDIDALMRTPGDFTDPVTGWTAPPSLNDLVQQRELLGSNDEVIVRPALPIKLTMPSDSDGEEMAVFLATPGHRVLGGAVIQPTYDVGEDGSRTPVYSTVLDLAPISESESVEVFVRSSTDSWACAPKADETPVLVLPGGDIAGSERVWLDLGDFHYEKVTSFD